VSNKIKLNIDNSDIKRSLSDLKGEINKLAKSKIELFNKDKDVLAINELRTSYNSLISRIQLNKREVEDTVKLQQKQIKGSKEHLKLVEKEARLRKQIASDSKTAYKNADGIQNYGKGSGMLGGLGIGGMLAGGALALGGFALSRGFQGIDRYKQGVGQRSITSVGYIF